jgi:hypothetical protein
MTTRLMFTAATLLLGGAPLLSAAPLAAQQSWTAWHGCWQPTGADAEAGALVCVLPGADAQAVRIVAVAEGDVIDETVVRADGVARPVDDDGCTGTESAAFSRDGRRVFTRAELDCSGVKRVSTGVLALISEVEWLDAQALTVGSQSAARAVQYRAVPRAALPERIAALLPSEQRLAVEAARLHAAAPLAVADVIEASRVLAAPALEALLGARQHGFGLNAAALLELERSGVAASTIDVMVALSYPARFAVEQRGSLGGGGWPEHEAQRAATWADQCYDAHWTTRRYRASCFNAAQYGYAFDRYGYGYDRYGLGYSPWGYSPWGYDRRGWNNQPIVIVRPRDEDDGARVIKGQGYTPGTRPSTGTAQPRTAAPRAQPATGSAGARSASPPASSPPATSTSGSDERRAKPRTGGGGGEG